MEEINTEHGIFTNNEKTGQSAQEVYNEWIANKDKKAEPNELEKLKIRQDATENALLFLMDMGRE